MAATPEPPFPDPAALARAEAALANLSDRYLGWAEADLVRLEACLIEVQGAGDGRTDRLGRMFAIAHDMKGQGSTFGYPLISELGGRLCRLLETVPDPSAQDMDRIAALAVAMGRVIRDRLAGDGGEDGSRLRAELL